MSEKLVAAIKKRVHDESLVPTDTLTGLMAVNNVSQPGKMSRGDLESYTGDAIDLIDFTQQLPQKIPLTGPFMKDVMDPVTSVPVPTGMYRVTMRKLLRLSLTQLQEQAELMKLDTLDLDEEGIASLILINMDANTEVTLALAKMLLSKEIAYVYGIKIELPTRGAAHPSSSRTFVLKPLDMVQDIELTRDDLIAECINQGISVNKKESKRQLAIRIVVWWSEHPDQLRQPFTPNFKEYILESSTRDHS